jgi:hypothetical protein
VGEVLSAPQASGNERWPWQVRRRLTHVCASLSDAPAAERVGVHARGLRVMKELSDEQGRLAESLIAAAGQPFSP